MRVLERAKQEGFDKGMKEGITIGVQQRAIEIARNMLADNFDLEVIKKTTGLSVDQIKTLQTRGR
jgi:predicted transposase/invertase (TIGR01784 family)